MGWPTGWTSLEPLEEAVIRAFGIDPADGFPSEQVFTVTTMAHVKRGKNYRGQQPEHYRKTPAEFAEETPREDSGAVPRLAEPAKDWGNRLKVLGNGQVPQCAASAFIKLYNEYKEED